MNAVQLSAGSKPVELWQCGKCSQLRNTLDLATRCCDWKCATCGVDVTQFRTLCSKCQSAEWAIEEAVKEKAAFAVAKDCTSSYEGPFIFDDRFCECIEEVLERCECKYLPVPEYLWVCEKIDFEICAISVLERALDEHHEDAIDSVDDKKLQAILDEFCKENDPRSYREIKTGYVRVKNNFPNPPVSVTAPA